MRSFRCLFLLLAFPTIGCASSPEGGDGEIDAGGRSDARSGAPDARRAPDAPETFDPVADAGPPDGLASCADRTWRNLLVNGNLDFGPTVAWVGTSARDAQVITTDAPLVPHSGSYVAWLAGYANGHEQLWQTVTVPPSATRLRFRGYACFVTDEPTFGLFDWSTVSLYDSSTLGLIEVLVDVSNADAAATCDFFLVEAAATSVLPGRTIDLVLEGLNDADYPTSFWWDSLAFEAYVCP